MSPSSSTLPRVFTFPRPFSFGVARPRRTEATPTACTCSLPSSGQALHSHPGPARPWRGGPLFPSDGRAPLARIRDRPPTTGNHPVPWVSPLSSDNRHEQGVYQDPPATPSERPGRPQSSSPFQQPATRTQSPAGTRSLSFQMRAQLSDDSPSQVHARNLWRKTQGMVSWNHRDTYAAADLGGIVVAG